MAMSRRLVELIERNADVLTQRWLRDVRKDPGTPSYHVYDEKVLYARAYSVYSHLGDWLSEKTTKMEIASHYTALGRQRRTEGFALSELIQALVITRRHIWIKVREDGLLDTAFDLYHAMELSNRVIVFFDRAIYYAALGYES